MSYETTQFVHYKIAATKVAAALGVFSTRSQIACMYSAANRSRTIYPTQREKQMHVKYQLDAEIKWNQIKNWAETCETQEDIQRVQHLSHSLLFCPPDEKMDDLIARIHTNTWSNWDLLTELESTNIHVDILSKYRLLFSLHCGVCTMSKQSYGSTGETRYIAEYNQSSSTPITCNGSMILVHSTHQTPIHNNSWCIQGKIDGLINNEIIEIKHRCDKIMSQIPLYEIVQLHVYMAALKKTRCRLVQCVRRKQFTSSHTTMIKFNVNFWNRVKDQLQAFFNLTESAAETEFGWRAFEYCENKEVIMNAELGPAIQLYNNEYEDITQM
jgi:hypothetical protein